MKIVDETPIYVIVTIEGPPKPNKERKIMMDLIDLLCVLNDSQQVRILDLKMDVTEELYVGTPGDIKLSDAVGWKVLQVSSEYLPDKADSGIVITVAKGN